MLFHVGCHGFADDEDGGGVARNGSTFAVRIPSGGAEREPLRCVRKINEAPRSSACCQAEQRVAKILGRNQNPIRTPRRDVIGQVMQVSQKIPNGNDFDCIGLGRDHGFLREPCD